MIGRSGAGYDKIDLAACTEHGVAVFNAPMALNHSTASSALLFMLALAKRLPDQERIARQGRWDRQAAVMGSEIQGRTLGIVGLGHSGRELVRLVAPFEMRVLAFSPHADPAGGPVAGRPPDLAGRGLARVGLRQPALPADRRDPAADRCGATGPDEADRRISSTSAGASWSTSGAGGRAARSQDRRRRPRCLRGRAAPARRSAARPGQRHPDAALVGIDLGRLAGDRPGDGRGHAPGRPRACCPRTSSTPRCSTGRLSGEKLARFAENASHPDSDHGD